MVADQPLVVYPKDDKEKAHTKRRMDEVADKWAEKHKGKSLAGQKISLGDYLRNGLNNK